MTVKCILELEVCPNDNYDATEEVYGSRKIFDCPIEK